jgi:hypothetical protein
MKRGDDGGAANLAVRRGFLSLRRPAGRTDPGVGFFYQSVSKMILIVYNGSYIRSHYSLSRGVTAKTAVP